MAIEPYIGRGNGPNYEIDGAGDLWVCDGDHDKSSPCFYRRATPEELAEYLRMTKAHSE